MEGVAIPDFMGDDPTVPQRGVDDVVLLAGISPVTSRASPSNIVFAASGIRPHEVDDPLFVR